MLCISNIASRCKEHRHRHDWLLVADGPFCVRGLCCSFAGHGHRQMSCILHQF